MTLDSTSELQCLLVNFNRVVAESGTVFTVIELPSEAADDVKINRMLAGDAAQRFYAAILLNESGDSRGQQVLRELTADASPVQIQTRVGHAVLEVPAQILADGFLSEGKIWTRDLETIENLAKWAAAIAHAERNEPNNDSLLKDLPNFAELWAARRDPAQMPRLRLRIAELSSKGAPAKFYAATLLATVDAAAAQQILESLLDDETPVWYLFGDIVLPVPACEIAAATIEERPIKTVSRASARIRQTPVDKFFDWLKTRS